MDLDKTWQRDREWEKDDPIKFLAKSPQGLTFFCKESTHRVATSAMWKNGTGGRSASTETPKASRLEGKVGGGIPLPIRLGVCGSVISSPSGVRGFWGPGQSPGKL